MATYYAITNYNWTMGDGTTYDGASYSNVAHQYTSSGMYTVTLILTNSNSDTSTRTMTVYVKDPYDIDTYEWSVDSNIEGTSSSLSHYFSTAALSLISLTLTNSVGETATKTLHYRVGIDYTLLYYVDFGDGLAVGYGLPQVHLYAVAGSYTAVLYDIGGFELDSESITILPGYSVRVFLAQIQSGSSYENDDMYVLPWVKGTLQGLTGYARDLSITSNPFKDVPRRDFEVIESNILFYLDDTTVRALSDVLMGDAKMSMGLYNTVNYTKYTSVFLQSYNLIGRPDQNWIFNAQLVAVNAERIAQVGTPKATAFGAIKRFIDSTIRIGDAVNALDSSDDQQLLNFALAVDLGFKATVDNNGTVTPSFAAPAVGGRMRMRYETDTFLDWADDATPLQMHIDIGDLDIYLPRLIVKPSFGTGHLTTLDLDFYAGRNGVSGHYKNSNMSYHDPVNYVWS